MSRVRVALAALVKRLEMIEADPGYQDVWMLHHVHGGRYTGPTYVRQLRAAKAALKKERLMASKYSPTCAKASKGMGKGGMKGGKK